LAQVGSRGDVDVTELCINMLQLKFTIEIYNDCASFHLKGWPHFGTSNSHGFFFASLCTCQRIYLEN